MAQDHGLSKQAVDLLPDEDRAWFEDVIDRVLGLGKTQSSLVKKTSQSILALAKLGRVILVGRGANLITRGMPGGVHVRLVGSPKKRVEHLVSYYGISHAQAEERVHQEDEGKRNYIRRYFHEDIDNPLLYDFTINTDHVSYDEAAKIISHAVTSVLHKSTSLFLAAP